MVKFEFEIYNCEFCSFLLFLQGEFQEKVNKLESESENEGRGSYFGRFSYFPFCQEPVHSGSASLPHPVFFLVLVSGF